MVEGWMWGKGRGLPGVGLATLVVLAGSCSDESTPPASWKDDPAAPVISFWYGDSQSFGTPGDPQMWANILGNASDLDGLGSLSYRLDGGAAIPIPFGSDGERLGRYGDFNIELDRRRLTSGAHSVEVTAVDVHGNTSQKTLTLNYQAGRTWPLPFTADFRNAGSMSEALALADIVDGRWEMTAQGLNVVEKGYDRLVALGDQNWTPDYDVRATVTLHDWSSWSGLGIAVGWQGHEGVDQPRLDWPLELLAWVRNITGAPDFRLETYDYGLHGKVPYELVEGHTYGFRLRTERIGDGLVETSAKVWDAGSAEPPEWTVTAEVPERRGGVLLVAHQAYVTWHDVAVLPLGANSPPGFSSGPPQTAAAGFVYVYEVRASDPDGDPVTITAAPLPAWLSLTDRGDGSAELRGTPQDGDLGAASISLTATDGQGASALQNFTLDVTAAPAAQSDEFDGTTLPLFWRFENPSGDGTLALKGGRLELAVPGGSSHELWRRPETQAPRVLQTVSDDDFALRVGFQSLPAERQQLQGIVVGHSASRFIRCGVYHDGHSVRLFAAHVDGEEVSIFLSETPSTGDDPYHLLLTRSGDKFTYGYSEDGARFHTAVTFEQPLEVEEVGVYAGNAVGEAAPPYRAVVDYFRNVEPN